LAAILTYWHISKKFNFECDSANQSGLTRVYRLAKILDHNFKRNGAGFA
jgi:hypothetical protein